MPLLGGAFADADQDASGFAGFENDDDPVRLDPLEIGGDEVLALLLLRGVQDGCTRFAGAVLHPVVILSGNAPQDLAANRVNLAVAPKEAHHLFGLLKRLDGSVEQHTVKATIVKTDVILMVFVKGVHGFLQSGIPGAYCRECLLFYGPPTPSSTEFSRSGSVAEGASVRARRLSIHGRLSPAGDLRLIPANASGCCLDRRQYRRRFRQAEQGGKSAVPQCGRRIGRGEPLFSHPGAGSRLRPDPRPDEPA